MPLTTPGRLLLQKSLPPGLLKDGDIIDKKKISSMMLELAEKSPEKYIDVLQDMLTVSREAAYRSGHLATVSPFDLVAPPEVRKLQGEMREEVRKIAQDPNIDAGEKNKRIASAVMARTKDIPKQVTDAAAARGNRLALAAKLGFRGNESQFQQIIFGDGMNADFKGRAIPIPAFTGYGQGVSPLQYWSGAYSARKGDVDTQFATAQTGYYCLAMDTLVRMADGSAKAIKDIGVGEQVLGASLDGTTAAATVVARHLNGVRRVFDYTFRNGSGAFTERCTPEHRLLGQAGNSAPGVYEMVAAGESLSFSLPLGAGNHVYLDSATELGDVETMDLEVDNADHLFVLASGLIVSNSKQLSAMAQNAVVSESDCGTQNGVVRQASDPDIIGAVLARDSGEHKAGEVVTRSMAKKLVDTPVVVRSTMSCQASGGICQKCTGIRDARNFPKIGSYLGIEAGRIVSEPLTQGLALNSRHVGGTAGVNDKTQSAFEEINQFTNTPSTFVGGATLAPADGMVTKIEPAPQGGSYVHVGGEQTYVPGSLVVGVKVGDKVEAGDKLSDGMLNIREFAMMRGVGEARKAFADGFHELLKEKGQGTSRKNVDILARELINRVEITDPDGVGGYEVGEQVSYDDLAKRWQRPDDAVDVSADKGIGGYLQSPTLHYTIGTRVTPSVAASIAGAGYQTITVSRKDPGFRPVIQRMIDLPAKSPDWITRLSGWNVKKGFVDAVQKGLSSSPENRSFARKMYLPEELSEDDEE